MFRLIVASSIVIGLLGGPVLAVDYTWVGTTSSNWGVSTNWSGGSIPPFNTTCSGCRLSVYNGAGNQLIYTAAEGHTIYTGGSSGRALFIGSGTTGQMTITGGTFENGGTGSVDGVAAGNANGTLIIDGGSYVNNAGTFDVGYGGAGTGTLTITSGSFTVGTLQFGGGGGTGILNLDGGTLKTGIVQRPSGTATFNFNGGTLVASASSTTFMQGLTNAYVKANGAIIDTNGYDITIGQALLNGGGGGGLTKIGNGTLTLTSAGSAYTGATTIGAGTLRIGADGAIPYGSGKGDVVVNAGTTLDVAVSANINGLSGSGTVDNSGSSHVILTIGKDHDTTTFDGLITDTGTGTLGLTKTGTGTLTLTAANSYSGATSIYGGLNIRNAGSLGNTSGISVVDGGRLELQGVTVVGKSITIDGGGGNGRGGLQSTDGTDSTWTGSVTLKVGGASQARLGTGAGNSVLRVSGVIDGGTSNGLGIRSADDSLGKVVLSGANTYSGPTQVVVGTLQLDGGDNRLPTGTVLIVGNSAAVGSSTFDLNGRSQEVAGLTDTSMTNGRTVTNTSGTAATLTVNNPSAAYTYAGAISGNLALTKKGAGTLTISGSNTYTGATTVDAGTLTIGAGGAVPYGSGKGDVVVNGTLDLAVSANINGLSGSGIIDNSGASNVTLTVGRDNDSSTFGGTVQDTGSGTLALTKTGTGTLTLTGASSYSGTTTVSTGVLNIQNGSALGTTAAGTSVENGATLQLQGGIAVGNEALTIGEAGVGGNGALRNVSGNNSWAGPITMRIDTQSRIQSDSGSLLLSGGITSTGNTLVLSGASGGDVSGTISGVHQLTKEGAGTWILSGANDYITVTNVNAGALNLRNNSALGTGAAGTAVANGAQVELQGGITVTGEALTIDGGGANLRGALQSVGGSDNTWAGNITLKTTSTAQARLGTTAGAAVLRVTGVIDGGTSLGLGIRSEDDSLGKVVLSGANTYAGPTQIVVGIVQLDGGDNRLPTGTVLTVGNSAGIGTSKFDLNGRNQEVAGLTDATMTNTRRVTNDSTTAATLTVNNPTTPYTYASPISGNLGLTKKGAGTLTISGTNTYSGSTNVNAGVLNVQNGNALGSTTVGTIVASGARVELQGGVTIAGEAISIAGDGGNYVGGLQSAGGTNAWNGPVTLASDGARIGANGPGNTLTVGGVIGDGTNSFALGVRNADTGGVTILTGANTYDGATRVIVGALKIDGGDNRLPTGTTLVVGVNGTSGTVASFDLNGWDQTVAGLQCDGQTTSAVTNAGSGPSTLTVNNTANFSYSGTITNGANSLSLVKSGGGKLTLSNADTYTGTTTISGGTLALASGGSIASSSLIDVGAGASFDVGALPGGQYTLPGTQTIKGNGTVIGNLVAASDTTVAPGSSPGKLTIQGNFTEQLGGTLEIEVEGMTRQTDYDWLDVTGEAALAGTLEVLLGGGFAPESGATFDVLTAAGGITVDPIFVLTDNGGLAPSQFWTYNLLNNETLFQLQVGVPEPSTLMLAAAVFVAGLLLAGRKRRRPVAPSAEDLVLR
jgi:fibronectin-binding autotransporter adhesin